MDEILQQLRAQALEHSLDAWIATDPNGAIIDWNSRATEIFGWDRTEAIGRNLGELILPPRHRPAYTTALEKFRATKEIEFIFKRFELKGLRRDQSEVPIEVQVTPVTARGTTALYASISDSSRRRGALEQVREREEYYQQILNSISDLILVKGENSRILWANRSFLEYYGMTNEQLKGIIDSPSSEPDHTQQYIKDDMHVFRTGTILNIPREPVTRHDGAIRWFHTVKSPISNGEGRTTMTVGTSRDITEQKETQEKLERNEELLQTLIDNSPFVVYVKDLEGRHVLVNREFVNMNDLLPTDVIGKTDEQIFNTELARSFRENDRHVIETGTSMQFDETLEIAGTIHSFFSVKFPLKTPAGKVYAVCGISTNVTEMRKAESTIATQRAKMVSAAKMSALGEMAGGIAHEINNPLAVIHLRASQIRQIVASQTIVPSEINDAAERIETTAMRISKIVKSLRSFSRDDAQDPFQVVSLQSIIDDTVNLCSARFMNHQVSLVMDPVPPGLTVECRPGQISQVLLNLMNNAHDAVESLADRWVRVRTLDEGEFLSVSVSDSGEGIPEPLREKIMEPFFTTKEIGKGTGLGLSISRGIIESHHGQLGVDPEGENTCFFFRVPKLQTLPNHRPPVSSRASAPPSTS